MQNLCHQLKSFREKTYEEALVDKLTKDLNVEKVKTDMYLRILLENEAVDEPLSDPIQQQLKSNAF